MNDLDYLQKKKGMTIGKAWMLMFGWIVSLFLTIIIYAVIAIVFLDVSDIKKMSYDYIGIVTFMSALPIIYIGYRINLREWPFTLKVSKQLWLWGLGISICLFFINNSLLDIVKLNDSMKESIMKSRESIIVNFSSFPIYFLIIGVIGHGLLRNYPFKKIYVTVCFLWIVYFFVPIFAIFLFMTTAILFFAYYKTASIQFTIGVMFMGTIVEILLPRIFKISPTYTNYLRLEIIGNDVVYYSLFAIAILFIIAFMIKLKKLPLPLHWQREIEYESFD